MLVRTGKFKYPEFIPERRGLDSFVADIEGSNKQVFLDLISRMLRWRPNDRDTAEDLLADPWFEQEN